MGYRKVGSYNHKYTITTDLTGYSDDQTINPSELNLWRVISKNDDGSIDMVSEYVSSTRVCFYGVTGYVKFVGTLNTIAKQYETEGITNGSRYLGYNGQIENCTSYSSSTDCPTDTLYTTDTNLVKTAVGNLIGYMVNDKSVATYWLAGRGWDSNIRVYGRYVDTLGRSNYGQYLVYDANEYSHDNEIRPIVTLKSGITATGFGTSDNPWKVN